MSRGAERVMNFEKRCNETIDEIMIHNGRTINVATYCIERKIQKEMKVCDMS